MFFANILNTVSVLQRGISNALEIPFTIIFPGSEIPYWFRYRRQGHEINIKVPSNWYVNSNFLGLAISAIIVPKNDSPGWFMHCKLDTHDLNSTSHHIYTFAGIWTYQLKPTPLESDHVWLAYIPSVFSFASEKWSHIKFSFSSTHEHVVKSCGICPVYVKGTSDEGDYYNGSALDEPNNSVLQDVTVRTFMSDNQVELDTLNTNPYAQDQEGVQQPNDSVLITTFTKRRRRVKLFSMIETCFKCDNQKPS